MLHGIDITLKQYAGWCKGLAKTEPLDVIYATRGGKTNKIGYIARADNAAVLFIRYLAKEMREPIRQEVEKRRMEYGGCSVSKIIASPPSPDLIKAFVNGDLKKDAPTTVTVPDDFTPTTAEDEDE